MKRRIHVLTLFVAACVFPISHASATDYYIDAVGGNDGNDGLSTNAPWASHTKAESTSLAAGDTVHFKRGSAFSGSIVISESGSPGNPIRLTSYGTGELPKFTNPSTSDESGNCIRVGGTYTIVENLHFHDTPGEYVSGSLIMSRLGAVRIDRYSDHCIIRSNVFMKCGQGIVSAGEHTLITKNYLDGPSFALWRTDSSSWGPMGIHLNIGNQEVSYNTIKNHGTTDSPWGSDGGAIEIDNGFYHKNNIYIHHNYSEGNAGFLESSWDYDFPPYWQEVYNWRVSFNVCYDGQSWLFMLAPCNGVYFDNNTIARYNGFGRAQNSGARMDVTGGTPVGVAAGAHFRNNLFIYTSSPYTGNRSGGALKTSNWYMKYNDVSATYGGDGNQAGSGDPQLVDSGNGNYNLMASSPLRGKGVNLSASYTNAVDFSGQALPTSGNWDVGAMQFRPDADYDADNMADSWEFDHGLDINTNDSAGNNDDDGASNYEEYIADTDPTNSLSIFELSILSATDITISWSSSVNRLYTLWCATDLMDADPWTPVSQMTNLPGTGGTMVYANPVTDIRGFFRTSVFLTE